MALSERPRSDMSGFRVMRRTVDFRNIEIKDLTTQTPSGLRYVDLVAGHGSGGACRCHHRGSISRATWLTGQKFEDSRNGSAPMKIPLMGLIPGLREGITGMKVGGRRKLIIPPELGFGPRGVRRNSAGRDPGLRHRGAIREKLVPMHSSLTSKSPTLSKVSFQRVVGYDG